MRKWVFFTMVALCLVLSGCGSSNVNYDGNLGLDFSKTKANNVVFKAYHSDTEDHIWKEIASFEINPKNGKYYDISLEDSVGKIVISADEKSRVDKDKEKVTYESKVLGFTETFIDEFEGNIPGLKTYGVENVAGEQIFKLFPVNNNSSVNIFENVALDKPYDTEGENLDNILITVEIK